ncbi:hypothetical protein A9C19_16820 [Bacillus weihaiensis]|uniref:Uncharacterized protein n=1 Tax=Bacillus weihaiensis TaxID=1547283 RepID=A0A1L3MVA1_9BACI|nr:hypothetical protein A9C19_16820 [Bacillus weihaiensis]
MHDYHEYHVFLAYGIPPIRGQTPRDMVLSPPSKFFYETLIQKNFGVGIEPTRTSKAGGAPFAFPLLIKLYEM